MFTLLTSNLQAVVCISERSATTEWKRHVLPFKAICNKAMLTLQGQMKSEIQLSLTSAGAEESLYVI